MTSEQHNKQQNTEQLWKQFANNLRRFLRSRLPNDIVTDDLLQETFLRAHRNADSLKDSQATKPWVYQIARNLVIDYYRSEPKHTLNILEPDTPQPTDTDLPIKTLNQQIAHWLTNAVNQLPENYKHPTKLSAIDGLPQQQIADQLGLSLEATKSRIRRGRALLKDALLTCCTFEKDTHGQPIDYKP